MACASKDVEKLEALHTVDRKAKCCVHYENSKAIPKKIKV